MDQQPVFNDHAGLTHRFSHDNLHISVSSRFDPPQANALIKLLQCNQANCKRIFIDVRHVADPRPVVELLQALADYPGISTTFSTALIKSVGISADLGN